MLQTPAAAAQTATRVVPLTLDDAVKAALDHNLDIAVQRLNPEINDISVREPESRLPAGAHLADLHPVADQRVDIDDHGRRERGCADRDGADHRQRGHRSEHAVRRRPATPSP